MIGALRPCPGWCQSAFFVLAVMIAALAPDPTYAHADLIEQIRRLGGEIAKRPNAPVLYLRRANLHRRHRTWPAAFADIAEARGLAPDLAEIDYAEAAMWLDLGKSAKAKVMLDRFLGRKPDHAGGLLLRARARRELKDPLGAAADLDLAIKRMAAPLPDIYLQRARILRGVGPVTAERLLAGLDAGVNRLGPVVALVALAIDVEAERNRPQSALEWLKRLPKILQMLPKWQARRGDLLLAADRREAALEAYRAALARLQATAHGRQSHTSRLLDQLP